MKRGITFYSIISMMIAIIVVTIGNNQIINASTNSKNQDNIKNKDNSRDMPFLLPLTSHSSDQVDNGKKNNFKNDIIPFP